MPAQTKQGRFNFPQLKPGTYTVSVEASGFEPQQVQNVFSGLGQETNREPNPQSGAIQADRGGQRGGERSSTRPTQTHPPPWMPLRWRTCLIPAEI